MKHAHHQATGDAEEFSLERYPAECSIAIPTEFAMSNA